MERSEENQRNGDKAMNCINGLNISEGWEEILDREDKILKTVKNYDVSGIGLWAVY